MASCSCSTMEMNRSRGRRRSCKPSLETPPSRIVSPFKVSHHFLQCFYFQTGTRVRVTNAQPEDRYRKVATWYEDGGPTPVGAPEGFPHLFCHHDWLRKRTMADQMQDAYGNYREYSDGRPYRHNDDSDSEARQKAAGTTLGVSRHEISPVQQETPNFPLAYTRAC